MRRVLRWLAVLVLVLIVLALGALLTVGRPLLFGPNARAVTARTFEATAGRQLSGIMPYAHLSRLTDDDMRAIFQHIKAQPAVQHRVSNTDEPTDCPLCGEKHGRGNLNVKTN